MNDLAALQDRVEQLRLQFHDATCRCMADSLEVRRRTFANGSLHHVLQCVQCGEQRGGALSASEAQARLDGRVALAFDPEIEETYRAKRTALLSEYTELQRRERQLRNPDWTDESAAERDQAQARVQRVASLIEQCTQDLVAELGEEQAADALAAKAIALRSKRREELFQSTRRFGSEAELKEWLVSHLSEDFDLHPEVPGRHMAECVRVQIDYLAYPKPHLLDAGFAAVFFGIEVKLLDPTNGFSRKAARGLWQAVSYTDAEFHLAGAAVRPKFALLFSNLSFVGELRLLDRLGQKLENDWALWRGLLQLANHANVGTLEIKGARDAWTGWKMAFSGGTYFSRRHRHAQRTYRLSDRRMIEKVRIGNF